MSREVAEKKTLSHQYGSSFGPVKAMLWKCWRLSRFAFIVTLLGSTTFMCGFFLFLESPQKDESVLFSVVMLFIAALSVLFRAVYVDYKHFADKTRSILPFHSDYAKPVRTDLLVTIPMMYIALTSMACYLVPAICLHTLFGMRLPLISVSFLILTLCIVLLMLVWFTQNRFLRKEISSIVLIFIQMLAFTSLSVSINCSTPNLLLAQLDFSQLDYLKLFLIVGGSIGVTVSAVERQRHGEQEMLGGTYYGYINGFTGLFRRKGPFTTRHQAYCWGILRNSGINLVLIAVVIPVPIVGLALILLPRLYDLLYRFPMLILCQILILATITGIVLGKKQNKNGFSLPVFEATRSLDTVALLQGKIIAIASCTLPVWSVMALVIWVGTQFFGVPSFLNRSVMFLRVPYFPEYIINLFSCNEPFCVCSLHVHVLLNEYCEVKRWGVIREKM